MDATRSDPQVLRVISWNIAHRIDAWSLLIDLGADIALLQEAVPPPASVGYQVRTWPTTDADWKVSVRGIRPYGAAIACFGDRLSFEPIEPVGLGQENAEDIAASHPGQFAAARVAWAQSTLTLVSLYGIYERQSGVGSYAEATLHRAISDLTPLMQSREPLLLAGDLNVFHGYSLDGSPTWRRRYDTVFDRLASYGMHLVGPFSGDGPLAGCRCGASADCRHVRTYRHQYREESSPDQLDFVFANAPVQRLLASTSVVANEATWKASDHAPVLTELRASAD